MSYGFKSTTDGRTIQIDDEYPILQFNGGGIARASVDCIFPSAVTTQQPPWIFIRPENGSPFFMGMKFLGGPGNWYGMKIHSCRDQYNNHGFAGRDFGSWKYIIGEWAVRYSKETYGMRIWDSNRSLIYDAGSRYIKLSFQFERWRYGYRHANGGWLYVMHYLNLPPGSSMSNPNNYLLINPFIIEATVEPDLLPAERKIRMSGDQLLSVTMTGWKGGADLIQPGIIGQVSN